MITHYILINRLLRQIQAAIRDAADLHSRDDKTEGWAAVMANVDRLVEDLSFHWPKDLDSSTLQALKDHLLKNDGTDFYGILEYSLPALANTIDAYFRDIPAGDLNATILDLLHPRIVASSYEHFRAARYRDAVLNSIITVFDLLRERTGLDKDGADLAAEAFSLQNPHLIVRTLGNESGRNEQKGFIQLLQGLYLGVRNPKAHTLQIDTGQKACAQYLVLGSLLCRRIDEAKPAK